MILLGIRIHCSDQASSFELQVSGALDWHNRIQIQTCRAVSANEANDPQMCSILGHWNKKAERVDWSAMQCSSNERFHTVRGREENVVFHDRGWTKESLATKIYSQENRNYKTATWNQADFFAREIHQPCQSLSKQPPTKYTRCLACSEVVFPTPKRSMTTVTFAVIEAKFHMMNFLSSGSPRFVKVSVFQKTGQIFSMLNSAVKEKWFLTTKLYQSSWSREQ